MGASFRALLRKLMVSLQAILRTYGDIQYCSIVEGAEDVAIPSMLTFEAGFYKTEAAVAAITELE